MTRAGVGTARERNLVGAERGGSEAESGSKSVLIVDDEPQHLKWLQDLLEENGYPTTVAENGSQACKMLVTKPYRVLITDLKMPGKSGIEVVEHMKRVQPDCIGIVVTGYISIEQSVEAIKAGAYDFLPKPISPKRVFKVIEEGLRSKALQAERDWADISDGLIISSSLKMVRVMELIDKVAASDSTVLVSGESGTGKELVAKTLHRLSNRSSKPFVVVHCGAIPETLLESEFFGHEKGAFTGAHRTRVGRFELADGGTIFLDEVGDIPLHLQLKLLRVLQDRKFERVGGEKTISADFRILAATNRDLQKEVDEGRFRLDLYYRLNVIPIDLPALRERPEDIQVLTQYYLDVANRTKLGSVEGFSPAAAQLMLEYPWPGNVRELENLMERLVVLKGSGIIMPADLPESFHARKTTKSFAIPSVPDQGVCLNSMVEELESGLIVQALDRCNWVKTRAAKLLNIKRTTLVEKVKKLGLERTASQPEGLRESNGSPKSSS